MRSIYIIIPLLLAGSAFAACGRTDTPRVAPSPSAAPAGGARFTVLPASAGPRLFGSCSPTPDAARNWKPAAYREPDAAVVREIESRLPALLDSVLPRMARANRMGAVPRGEEYYRQYLGFIRDGDPLVFVHGIHEAVLRWSQEVSTGFDWRTEPFGPCDAGAGLFGVVYDPRTRTFGPLEFSFTYGGAVTY